MPGVVVIGNADGEIARARYGSKNERNNIISFFNFLYDLKGYTVTISPDNCGEDQIQAQCLQAGCYYSYMRNDRVHADDSNADSAVVFKKVI